FVRNPFLIFAQFPLPTLLLLLVCGINCDLFGVLMFFISGSYLQAILTDRKQLEKAAYSPALSLSLNQYKTLYLSSFHDQDDSSKALSRLYSNLVHSSGSNVYLDG